MFSKHNIRPTLLHSQNKNKDKRLLLTLLVRAKPTREAELVLKWTQWSYCSPPPQKLIAETKAKANPPWREAFSS